MAQYCSMMMSSGDENSLMQKKIYCLPVPNMNSIKICRVCGGIATGFNYDGLSCESCKVFFCRNSALLETLTCNYDENCEITIFTRKKCSKCRLIKCCTIGMVKKIQENSATGNNFSSVENKILNKIEKMLEVDILESVHEYEQISGSTNNKILQIQKRRLQLELNHYELECIREARKAFGVFQDERTSKVTKRITNVKELVNSPLFHNLLYIKKSINFCQNFAAFNSLSNEDQLVLLKPFCFSLIEIWFTFQYDVVKDGFFAFIDETETSTIFVGSELWSCTGQEIAQKLRKFSFSLYSALENDVTIRDLIATLLLFKTQDNLSCLENIRYQYYLYSSILQRYLHWKCQNRKDGNRKYLALMRLLEHIDIQFRERKKQSAIEFIGQDVPAVVQELYNIY